MEKGSFFYFSKKGCEGQVTSDTLYRLVQDKGAGFSEMPTSLKPESSQSRSLDSKLKPGGYNCGLLTQTAGVQILIIPLSSLWSLENSLASLTEVSCTQKEGNKVINL